MYIHAKIYPKIEMVQINNISCLHLVPRMKSACGRVSPQMLHSWRSQTRTWVNTPTTSATPRMQQLANPSAETYGALLMFFYNNLVEVTCSCCFLHALLFGKYYECSHFDVLLSGVSSTPFCRGGNLQYPRIFG